MDLIYLLMAGFVTLLKLGLPVFLIVYWGDDPNMMKVGKSLLTSYLVVGILFLLYGIYCNNSVDVPFALNTVSLISDFVLLIPDLVLAGWLVSYLVSLNANFQTKAAWIALGSVIIYCVLVLFWRTWYVNVSGLFIISVGEFFIEGIIVYLGTFILKSTMVLALTYLQSSNSL